ncbi:MAG: hypothetical protein ACOY5R_04230 [Pseudomonadota bacterium]|uniref:hypothetical protein n=1 Tax=Rhizorhabdus phycosphaerae TaxID=2711156 RepID=UPI0013EDEBAD|nr:hypothetical protein [Rhizorhabdus phycosphaerae]
MTEQTKSTRDCDELDQFHAGSAARQNWLAPSLSVIDVSDATYAGGPGTTDSTILS